jgi:hypothetical protein
MGHESVFDGGLQPCWANPALDSCLDMTMLEEKGWANEARCDAKWDFIVF